MIFTECPSCDEPYVYPYEAGDKPCGMGVFGVWTCPKCGAKNCTERTVMCGETYSEEELVKLGAVKREKDAQAT